MRIRGSTLLVAFLALFLAFGLAACGGDDEEAPPAPAPGVGEDAEPGEAGIEVETIQAGTLTVGSDVPFPPFEFREGDELVGFDVDLIEEMASRLDLETRWIETDFETIFTQLAAARFDVVASATTITEERQQQVNFTDPYYNAQQSLSVNTEATPDIQSTDDLQPGQVVAVQRGTTGEAWARENLPEGVEIRSFPDSPDTYTALEAANVAAVIFDEPSAVGEAARRPALEVVETIDTGERYGFAVNPQNEALLDALNQLLQDMVEDGTYDEIYDRYEDLGPGGTITDGANGETDEETETE